MVRYSLGFQWFDRRRPVWGSALWLGAVCLVVGCGGDPLGAAPDSVDTSPSLPDGRRVPSDIASECGPGAPGACVDAPPTDAPLSDVVTGNDARAGSDPGPDLVEVHDGPPDVGADIRRTDVPLRDGESGDGGDGAGGVADSGHSHDGSAADDGGGDACAPSCAGRACGDDGCGGTCGDCVGRLGTCEDGRCVCTPDCTGHACGDDWCGGSCGECGADSVCRDWACAALPAACDGAGLVVVLQWFQDADLDLYVLEPTDEVVGRTTLRSTSGGVLALESNRDCVSDGLRTEVICWPDGAPSGLFDVSVAMAHNCRTSVAAYRIFVRSCGQERWWQGELDAREAYDAGPCCVDGACDPDHCAPPIRFRHDPSCRPACAADGACGDGDACTLDRCVSGACRHEPSGIPGCCEDDCCADDADCATGDPCASGSCLATGHCAFVPLDSAECCSSPVWSAAHHLDEISFENETWGGWAVSSWPAIDGVAPQIQYGEPYPVDLLCPTGRGAFRTPAFRLPPAVASRVEALAYLDIDAGDRYDRLSVRAEFEDGDVAELWRKDAETPQHRWIPLALDLSAFGGRTLRLAWSFEGIDRSCQLGAGVQIAGLAVTSTCAPRLCAASEDCDDGLAFTADRCLAAGSCAYAPATDACDGDAACNDGNPCTRDRCFEGHCERLGSPGCCHVTADCEDGDPCTTDVCAPNGPTGRCENIEREDCCVSAPDCDDSNACTDDFCPGVGGACQHLIASGCCVGDADCDDRDDCTRDRCVEWRCERLSTCCAADVDCDDADDRCTSDTCGEDGRCRFEPTGEGGCCDPAPLTADWSGLDDAGFTFDNADESHGWALVPGGPPGEGRAAAPYLYYGDPDTLETYATPAASRSEGEAWSAPFLVPAGAETRLRFVLFRNTGHVSDGLSILVDYRGHEAQRLQIPGGTSMAWEQYAVDLSFAEGAEVRVGIRFESRSGRTLGSLSLPWHGLFVDDFRVESTCAPRPCFGDADCGAPDCVAASCEAGRCAYDAAESCCNVPADCEDDDACTLALCIGGVCSWRAADLPGCCSVPEECDEGAPCVVPGCRDAHCESSFVDGCTTAAPWCESFEAGGSLSALGFGAWGTDSDRALAWSIARPPDAEERGQRLVFAGAAPGEAFEQCVETPALDPIGLGGTATLRFSQELDSSAASRGVTFEARVTPDGGVTWTTVWSWPGGLATSARWMPTGALTGDAAGAPSVRAAVCVVAPAGAVVPPWSIDDLCLLPGAAPTLAPIGELRVPAGTEQDVSLHATDADGDALTMTIQNRIGFATLVDLGGGDATLHLAPGLADAGRHEILLGVGDGTYDSEPLVHVTVVERDEVTLLDEDFEAAGAVGDLAASGWEERLGGVPGDTNWAPGGAGAFPGVVARFSAAPPARDFDHRLVSPAMDVGDAASIIVRWDDALTRRCCDATLVLVLYGSPDDGVTWVPLWAHQPDVEGGFGATAHAVDATIPLEGAAAARIAFAVEGAAAPDGMEWSIDRVVVEAVLPP